MGASKLRVNSDALSSDSGGPSAVLRQISSHTEKLQYGGTRQENSVTDDPSIGGILNAQARGGVGEITGDMDKENFLENMQKKKKETCLPAAAIEVELCINIYIV